jgi:hypothetical protein
MSPADISVRKLKKAGARIREAADLIKEAVDGTGLEERGQDLISDLKNIIDSKESSKSLRNLSLDIEQAEEKPVWMRPAVSVKNSGRKDI